MLPGGASEIIMMMSSSGNIFLVTGPLWGESIGHRWIPLTKASDAELWCFFDLRLKKGWANNRDDDDFGPNRVHYNVPVMIIERPFWLHKHQPQTFGMQHICNLVFFSWIYHLRPLRNRFVLDVGAGLGTPRIKELIYYQRTNRCSLGMIYIRKK